MAEAEGVPPSDVFRRHGLADRCSEVTATLLLFKIFL